MTSFIDPNLMIPPRPAPQNGENAAPEALRQTCEAFEAIFTQQLFKAMRATVTNGGLLEKGKEHDIFSGMMDQVVARDLAGSGTLGIAELLLTQLEDPG